MSKIFISRPLNKNSLFVKALKGNDLEIVGQSLIHFTPIPFSSIPKVDWLFFYSKNGIKFFFEQVQKSPNLRTAIQNKKWAVIGKGTATALRKQAIQPDFVGTGSPATTAEQFQIISQNQSVLFVQAKISKRSVQKLLDNPLGLKELVVYDNQIKPNYEIPYCDILVFTSPLNVKAYYEKYPINVSQKVITIGNTTAKAVQELGINEVVIANKPTETEMAKRC